MVCVDDWETKHCCDQIFSEQYVSLMLDDSLQIKTSQHKSLSSTTEHSIILSINTLTGVSIKH